MGRNSAFSGVDSCWRPFVCLARAVRHGLHVQSVAQGPYRLLYCCEGRVARGGERLVKPVARDSRLARELGTLLLESPGRR